MKFILKNAQNQLEHMNYAKVENLELLWMDDEGDFITCSSDEEVAEAYTFASRQAPDYVLEFNIRERIVASNVQVESKVEQTQKNDVPEAQNVHKRTSKNVEPGSHVHVRCDMCGQHPIIGARFKCVVREDYDICESCERNHTPPYPMVKIYSQNQKIKAMVVVMDSDEEEMDPSYSKRSQSDTRKNAGAPALGKYVNCTVNQKDGSHSWTDAVKDKVSEIAENIEELLFDKEDAAYRTAGVAAGTEPSGDQTIIVPDGKPLKDAATSMESMQHDVGTSMKTSADEREEQELPNRSTLQFPQPEAAFNDINVRTPSCIQDSGKSRGINDDAFFMKAPLDESAEVTEGCIALVNPSQSLSLDGDGWEVIDSVDSTTPEDQSITSDASACSRTSSESVTKRLSKKVKRKSTGASVHASMQRQGHNMSQGNPQPSLLESLNSTFNDSLPHLDLLKLGLSEKKEKEKRKSSNASNGMTDSVADIGASASTGVGNESPKRVSSFSVSGSPMILKGSPAATTNPTWGLLSSNQSTPTPHASKAQNAGGCVSKQSPATAPDDKIEGEQGDVPFTTDKLMTPASMKSSRKSASPASQSYSSKSLADKFSLTLAMEASSRLLDNLADILVPDESAMQMATGMNSRSGSRDAHDTAVDASICVSSNSAPFPGTSSITPLTPRSQCDTCSSVTYSTCDSPVKFATATGSKNPSNSALKVQAIPLVRGKITNGSYLAQDTHTHAGDTNAVAPGYPVVEGKLVHPHGAIPVAVAPAKAASSGPFQGEAVGGGACSNAGVYDSQGVLLHAASSESVHLSVDASPIKHDGEGGEAAAPLPLMPFNHTYIPGVSDRPGYGKPSTAAQLVPTDEEAIAVWARVWTTELDLLENMGFSVKADANVSETAKVLEVLRRHCAVPANLAPHLNGKPRARDMERVIDDLLNEDEGA
jgi:hypothetical protein